MEKRDERESPDPGTGGLPASRPRARLQVLPPFLRDDDIRALPSPPLFLQHVHRMALFSQCVNSLTLSHIANSQLWFPKHVTPFQRFRGACLGAGTGPPCQSSVRRGPPRRSPCAAPEPLSACLASFWGAFVLLFHLRKDTLVTNQSSAC